MRSDLLSRHQVVATTDLDVAREGVSARYCPHRLALTRRDARLDLVHNAVSIGQDVAVNYMRYGDEVRITPGRFERFYLVQVPLSGVARVRFGDQEIVADRRRAFVGSPTKPVDMIWSDDCTKLVVYIRRAAMEELAGTVGREPVVFRPEMSLDRPAARNWMRLLWLAVEQLEGDRGLFASPNVAASFEQTLITGLLEVQPNSARDVASTPATSRSVRTVHELIEAEPDRAWRIAELASGAGVSVRSLQEAFRRERGVSPLEHLRRTRLELAHQELLRGDPSETTVTEVAGRWGFFHLGRFSQAYRARYQELPSQTLAH